MCVLMLISTMVFPFICYSNCFTMVRCMFILSEGGDDKTAIKEAESRFLSFGKLLSHFRLTVAQQGPRVSEVLPASGSLEDTSYLELLQFFFLFPLPGFRMETALFALVGDLS